MTQHDSETLQKGQQVITVVAVLYKIVDNTYKIFLPKRAETKKFLPGVYELPGGHVDFGENLVGALKREIKEEFKAIVNIEQPFAAFTYMNHVKQTHSVEIVYFGRFQNEDQKITLDPSDHSDYIWISSDEIEKIYTDNKGPGDDEMLVVKQAFELLNARAETSCA